MISFIGPLLFFYPIWGGICLFFVCRKLGGKGTMFQRVVWGLVVATVSTVIFTPVMFGTEGFGFFAPWMIVLFDPKHTGFWWPISAFIFIAAFIINMMNGEARSD